MDSLLLLLFMGSLWFFNKREQLRRIHLLAGVLGQYQVEKLMETVADGYLRALGEPDPDRAQQVWNMLDQAEATLAGQITAFVEAVAALDASQTRFSTLPLALPYAAQLFPRATVDLCAVLKVHRDGVARLMQATTLSRKDRAFVFTAELLLLQHSCHWFCRSKAMADARMRAKHQTPHAQLLASVSEPTRSAYLRLVG